MIYLFICILFVLLYSLVKTMCSVISIIILGNACIGPYCMNIRLPLEESCGTLKCNPYLTKGYTFYPTDNQTIFCPVIGMNNYKHDIKGQCDTKCNTIADHDAQCLSNNTSYSSLNRTYLIHLSQCIIRTFFPQIRALKGGCVLYTET